MPAKITKKDDGSLDIEVSRVESKRTLRPHDLVSYHLTMKNRKRVLEEELAHVASTHADVMPHLAAVAEEQVLHREAEATRIQEGGQPVPESMLLERDWWKNLYEECGGDPKVLSNKVKMAKQNPNDAKYTHSNKMSTPR